MHPTSICAPSMASLLKRNGVYYIVFSRRENEKLLQKRYSLRTSKKKKADKLKVEYGEQFDLGEIDPWGDWSPKKAAEEKRSNPVVGRTIQELSEKFLASRSHVAPATRKDYEWHLSQLRDCLGITMPVQLVREEDIRAICFRSDISKATQTTYLRFCRMFFKWLTDEGYIEENVCEGIKYPKKQQKVGEKTINELQLLEIFEAFKRVQRPLVQAGRKRGLHTWFKPVIATLFYTGLRRKEAIALQWEHVAMDAGYIHISRSKSGKERVVPIQSKLRPYLETWHRHSGRPSNGVVFFGKRGRDRRYPLSPDHVSKTYKYYAREANMPETVNLHGLRHSCATYLLRKGFDISDVASWLGHSHLETTRIYEHLDETDLKRKMDRLGL